MTRGEFDTAFTDYYSQYLKNNADNPKAEEWVDALLKWYEYVITKEKYIAFNKDAVQGMIIASTRRRWIDTQRSKSERKRKLQTHKPSFISESNNPQFEYMYSAIVAILKDKLTDLEYDIFVLHFEHKLRFAYINKTVGISRTKMLEIVQTVNSKLLEIVCKWHS